MAQYIKNFRALTPGALSVGDVQALGWSVNRVANLDLDAVSDSGAVGGVALRMTNPGVALFGWDGSKTTSVNGDILMLIKFSDVSTFDALGAAGLFRWAESTGDDWGNWTVLSDADWGSYQVLAGSASVQTYGEGTITNIASPSTLTDTWIWVRFQHESDGAGNFTRRAKAWLTTESEPASWDFENTDDKYEWDSSATPGTETLGGFGFMLDTINNPASSTSWIGFWGASDDLNDPVTVADATASGTAPDGTYEDTCRHLDRRVSDSTTGVSAAFDGTYTTWTIPYDVATDGSEGTLTVVNRSDGTTLASDRPATNQIRVTGDYVDNYVYIGIVYTSEVTLSTVYYRDSQGRAKTNGRTVMRYCEVNYRDTTDLEATVATTGVTGRTSTVDVAAATDGELRLPLFALNEYLTVTLGTSTAGSFNLLGILWEGDRIVKSRRNF